MELAKRYLASDVENGRYTKWQNLKLFRLDGTRKEKYTIVIPPPNVTGKLHLGHAWDNTLQDILIRFHHSLGKDTLYLPGMDHAGIATQAVVEAKLRLQGVSRYDLGREKFLETMWQWKEEYAQNIRKQWARLGLALHDNLERFTLDEGLSKAVKEVFIRLYREGLIYRGERIINWDPDQQTALSNIEVIHKEIEGKLYHIKYALVGTNAHLVVATTRPETMFADVCLVVNPSDERYQHLIGKTVINPSNGDTLPIISDSYVETSFGSGVMKCTPAHDVNDFALSERHGLARPSCMHPNGTMNDRAGKFAGLDRFIARAQLVENFKQAGVLDHIENIIHAVGHSERSDAIVEPYLSKQWFVKMKPLAEHVLTLQASENKIRFYPDRFSDTLKQWMEKVEDWCISRQLWWGHQIPAWYHRDTGEVYVGSEPPNNAEAYKQDDDVLDTWFSSALWPFSTLGWPDQGQLLKEYFPTSTMVTGYDIIFFWVARMAFQSIHFLGKKPFDDVLIHGIIRDAQGRKMSKSLGNGVDPIKVIDQYGTDALRLYLASNSSPGQDTRYSEEKVEAQANYLNKIWNSARFIFSHLPSDYRHQPIDTTLLGDMEKAILKRLDEVSQQVKANLLKYEIGFASTLIYDFVYDDFCSWYLEFSKLNLHGEDITKKSQTIAVLYEVLKAILVMLHPFAPFITEAIYEQLPQALPSLYMELYPLTKTIELAEDDYGFLVNMIRDIRAFKVRHQLAPNAKLNVTLQTSRPDFLKTYGVYLERFSFSPIIALPLTQAAPQGETLVYHQGSLTMAMIVDEETLKKTLLTQEAFEISEIQRGEAMLKNENFIKKAPEKKIQEEQAKLSLHKEKLKDIQDKLAKLS